MDVACFDCADCLGRIRPGMAVQQAAAELQKGKGATDQSLQGDFDGALEQMAEAGGVRFLPGAAVDLGSTYGFRVFQDFGILTKQEYSTLVGVDPKDIGVSPCNLPFMDLPQSSTCSPLKGCHLTSWHRSGRFRWNLGSMSLIPRTTSLLRTSFLRTRVTLCCHTFSRN